MSRPGPPRVVAGPDESLPGADYTDEERLFLMAMERYKRQRRRPFPTWREVLQVFVSLGNRKVAEPRNPKPPPDPPA
jgi:hypothetical protein